MAVVEKKQDKRGDAVAAAVLPGDAPRSPRMAWAAGSCAAKSVRQGNTALKYRRLKTVGLARALLVILRIFPEFRTTAYLYLTSSRTERRISIGIQIVLFQDLQSV
jgi:hypothetical protein